MSATAFQPDFAIPAAVAPEVESFFDPATFTVTHVVADPATKRAAIVDPVLDYDPASGRTSTQSADAVIAHVRARGLTVDWILETHVHADHLSSAPHIRDALGGRVGIGANIRTVQKTFGDAFNAEPGFARDGSQFDHLFADGERFAIGSIEAVALHTPGHTPACMTHVMGDAVFVGDTLFMPDGGTARADFPGGDAAELYRSIRKVLSLPEDFRLFMCHDYAPNGRDIRWETTVGEERAHNIHARDGISEDEFVSMRTQRDATLGMPKLIIPSIQVNMRAGRLPPKDESGKTFLKVPVNEL